ncbi:hypothetical protein AIOL_000938 [Candidatus Rhodobacter oscarellae]|uniref:Uncharacterized protein n=1 Tax=Candidatus Rhodobacter oscarellae TaxID=1675527 RepID=A0A0J9H5B0_9RHOB|nr:hypothetical protein [Candidatus Rhodobacter lobularis]KMW60773.1 hypothetical protein AIOL_000938 [Candidatus Rhodobacter lobularis]
MEVNLKDILTWGGMVIGLVAQWFHLKGRVAILETKQELQKEHHEESMSRITRSLERIERKLDDKADK